MIRIALHLSALAPEESKVPGCQDEEEEDARIAGPFFRYRTQLLTHTGAKSLYPRVLNLLSQCQREAVSRPSRCHNSLHGQSHVLQDTSALLSAASSLLEPVVNSDYF